MGVQLGEEKTGQKGMTIMDVVADGPADKAELMKDDIIIMVDNQPIKDMVDLKSALASKKANDKVELVIQRGAETRQVTLILEAPGKTE
jgi:S1-C subfamily serine protease